MAVPAFPAIVILRLLAKEQSGGPEVPKSISPPEEILGASSCLVKECERLLYRGKANEVDIGVLTDVKDKKQWSYFELYDYVGAQTWKGIITGSSLMVFFESSLSEKAGLKQGIVALLELASECLSVSEVIILLDRQVPRVEKFVRSFLWIGFDLIHSNHGGVDDAWIKLEIDI